MSKHVVTSSRNENVPYFSNRRGSKARLIIAICFLMFSGCGIGASIVGTVHSSIDQPIFSRTKGKLTNVIGQSEYHKVRKESLIAYWGQPDSTRTLSERSEVLTYNFGFRWNGIGLWLLLIPVPLVVPVGHDYIDITIYEGYVTSVETSEEDHVLGGFCGITPLGMFGPNKLCYGAKQHEKNRVSGKFKLELGRDNIIINDL